MHLKEEVFPKDELYTAMIAARLRAGFTQAELARRMHTVQPVILRVESRRWTPNLSTLEKWAEVTAHRLEVWLTPTRRRIGKSTNSRSKIA